MVPDKGMQLNEDKTQRLMFIGDHNEEHLRFLVITIDNQLTWKVHIEEIKKKLHKSL